MIGLENRPAIKGRSASLPFERSSDSNGFVGSHEQIIERTPYILAYYVHNIYARQARLVLSLTQPSALADSLYTDNNLSKVVLMGGEVSGRSFYFNHTKNGVITITSASLTRPGFEGKGLGSTLGLMSDRVIRDVMRRYPEDFDGKTVIARIIDAASASDDNDTSIVRSGWSSALAVELGYKREKRAADLPQFKKVYQKS